MCDRTHEVPPTIPVSTKFLPPIITLVLAAIVLTHLTYQWQSSTLDLRLRHKTIDHVKQGTSSVTPVRVLTAYRPNLCFVSGDIYSTVLMLVRGISLAWRWSHKLLRLYCGSMCTRAWPSLSQSTRSRYNILLVSVCPSCSFLAVFGLLVRDYTLYNRPESPTLAYNSCRPCLQRLTCETLVRVTAPFIRLTAPLVVYPPSLIILRLLLLSAT